MRISLEILSDLVKSLSSPRMTERSAQEFAILIDSLAQSSQFGTVAGSSPFGVYEMDFGWGRPVKVDVISIREEKNLNVRET
ncbi:unnamed protein product [Arabis nemorensis]|uniref:Uncharacterized protein n=1 Tax=Arabis nemorensis TaxID=586526 RepID=A0A565AYR9_9BRAS|nr:unnamed protein product [Arabis nemorensis]